MKNILKTMGISLLVMLSIAFVYQSGYFPVNESARSSSKTAGNQKEIENKTRNKVKRVLNRVVGKGNFEVLVSVELQGKDLELERIRKKPRKLKVSNSEVKNSEKHQKNDSKSKVSKENAAKPSYSNSRAISPGFSGIIKKKKKTVQNGKNNSDKTNSEKAVNSSKYNTNKNSEIVYFDVNKEVKRIFANSVKSTRVLILLDQNLDSEKTAQVEAIKDYLVKNLGLNLKQGDALDIETTTLMIPQSISERLIEGYSRNELLTKTIAAILLSILVGAFITQLYSLYLKKKETKQEEGKHESKSEEEDEKLSLSQLTQQDPSDLAEVMGLWLDEKETNNDL